eukprot:symbB.v1.2.040222.t1/scaffold7039.1/size14331/3
MDPTEYFALIANFQANRNFSQTFSDTSSLLSVPSFIATNTPSDFENENFSDDETDADDEYPIEFDVHWVLDFANRTRLHFPYFTRDSISTAFRNMIARPEFDGYTLNDLKFYLRGHQLDDRDFYKPFEGLFGMEEGLPDPYGLYEIHIGIRARGGGGTKRNRVDDLEGKHRVVAQRISCNNQFKDKVREAFESCTYNVPDISSKLCPIFEPFIEQLNETIKQAEEAKKVVLSSFGVAYAKQLAILNGTKLEHSHLIRLLDDRKEEIESEEKMEAEIARRIAQMNIGR